jgi:hypothetical protein
MNASIKIFGRNRSKIAVLLAAILVVVTNFGIFSSTAGAASPDVSGHVSGQLPGQAAQALADVVVTAEDVVTSAAVAQAVSDTSGFYSLLVPPGTYDLQFSLGSGSQYSPTTLNSVVISADQTIDIILTSSSVTTFSGVLRASSGVPVSDALVGLSDNSGQFVTTQTATDGSFSLTVSPQGHPFSLFMTGGNAVGGLPGWSFDVEGISMASSITKNLMLPPTVNLTVAVQAGDGTPLANATVDFPPFGGLYASGARVGDLTGTLTSKGLSGVTDVHGDVTFAVFPGSQPASGLVTPPSTSSYGQTPFTIPTITTDTTVVVNSLILMTTFSGVLRASSGVPVPNALVMLSDDHGSQSFGQTATDGSFSLTATPQGFPFSLSISETNGGGGFSFVAGGISMTSNITKILTLPPAVNLTVAVQTGDGTPLANAVVDLPIFAATNFPVGDLSGSLSLRDLSASTDAHGNAIFTVFAGNQPVTGEITPPATSSYGQTPFNVPTITTDTTVVVKFVLADRVPPGVTGTPDRPPNSAGWYNHPVTVDWTPTDPAPSSGSPTVPPSTVVNADGYGQLITSDPSCDPAGNCATGSVTLNYDATAPTATSSADRAANAAGWYNAPVAVSLSCTDLLSGVASCPAAQTLSSDGKAQTVSGTATDIAGNSGTVTSDPVNIDQTPPQVSTSLSPAAPDGAHGWYVSPVTVSTTCSDALSGVASCSKDQVIAGNGAGQTRNGAGSDLAGNTATTTSAPVNIDGIAPQTTANLTCGGSNGYCTGSTAQLSLAATDQGGSGVDSIRYRVNGGAWQSIPAASGTATLTMPQSGTVQVDFYATDIAGNAEPMTSLPIRADQTPPVISHTVNPSPNADGWTRAATTVHFTATDDFSGVAAITGDTTIGADTGPSGASVTGTATNVAGLSASDTVLVKLDTTAPGVTYSITPAAPASGWYTGPVTVHFTCTDPSAGNGAAGSGIASCPADRTVVTDGRNQTLTVTATDIAGNSTTLTTRPFNIDATGPQISFNAADGSTLPSGTTQVSGQVSDPTSGMATYTVTVQKVNKQGKVVPSNRPPTPVTCTGPSCTWTAQLGGGSGNPGKPSAYQITVTGTDVAGNSSTTTEVVYD